MQSRITNEFVAFVQHIGLTQIAAAQLFYSTAASISTTEEINDTNLLAQYHSYLVLSILSITSHLRPGHWRILTELAGANNIVFAGPVVSRRDEYCVCA